MKISKVEFQNFRNFKDYCKIDFPTDGSVTIIYGPNGVGKTTLHQLFQWIFYGEVHFNRTASDKMYNLELEYSLGFNQAFSVFGAVDFEHPNSQGVVEYYSLRRELIYRKEQYGSKLVKSKFRLSKKIGDDWKTISNDPSSVIEQILPSGLSQYFFFDGESMIADLNQTGKASAKALRKALYSIFDLDIYEQAIVHIGTQSSGNSTVLGKLYQNRSQNSTNNEIIIARGLYNQALNKYQKLESELNNSKNEYERIKINVKELSEKIGSNPSQEQLEKRRRLAKNSIKNCENTIKNEMLLFGKSVMDNYPFLFMSRIIEEVKFRIGLKVEEEKLLPGLTKDLVLSLLKESTCLCGNPICEKEKESLETLKKMFPPLSYKYIYDRFKNEASRWKINYNNELLLRHLKRIFENQDNIRNLQEEIHDIDEEQKRGQNVDELIASRAKAEKSLEFWNDKARRENGEINVAGKIRDQRKRKLDELLEAYEVNKTVDYQIEIMESVKKHFEEQLRNQSKFYSDSLRNSIQGLLDIMLTSTRKVSMNERFTLVVRDSFGDEAKSEGQFAVVSFAYIGGIFKLLNESKEFKNKEFPLILDGPFSKLDVVQRQNVINTIPTYAPQVILFSKDDINNCFLNVDSLNVWTIYSNEEKNVSYVKKGYNPEVFSFNEGN